MTHRAPPPGVVLRRLRDDDSFAELTTFLHRAYAPLAARGYTELACDTAAPAAELIALYERWGFRRVGSVTWDTVNYSSVLLSKTLGPVA